jgi:hypothetical protein
MSLILGKSAFLHIPKTGGTWVRRVLTDGGLVTRILKYDDPALTSENRAPSHHSVIKPEDTPPVVFAFVRHPLTWYRSYWSWKEKMFAWNPGNPFDRQCASRDYFGSLGNVIKHYPGGYLNEMYPFFTRHCTDVGRYEALREDLMRILAAAGEPIDEAVMARTPNDMSSSQYSLALRYPISMAVRLMDLEGNICDEYDYHLPDDVLL